jgi:hypothetical protein
MNFSRYGSGRPACQLGLRHGAMRCLVLLGSMTFAAAAHADNPSYNRPGLAFSPNVLDAGDVTFEQGLPDWTRGRDSGTTSSLYTADSLLRVGLGHQLELALGDSLYNYQHITDAGGSSSSEGRGDSSVLLKLALPSPWKPLTWGLQGGVEFTDGARDFRNDRNQYQLGVAANWQLNQKNTLGAYLNDLRMGGRDSDTFALSESHALNDQLAIYAEVAIEHDPDNGNGTLGGGGVIWQVTHNVQLDASFRHRLSGYANDWEGGLGASVYFGH